MRITVTGKHMDVGDALRQHIEEKLTVGLPKYIDNVTDATVVISRQGQLFHADIVVNPGTDSHITIKGTADSHEAYAAFDAAAERVEKQLRRYKRKLKGHSQQQKAHLKEKIAEASHYVLASNDEHDEVAEDHTPLVIAENAAPIEELTVSDAVMRLDLSGLPALMFINQAHGGLNTIYRRPDGNIAWIDPRIVGENTIRKVG